MKTLLTLFALIFCLSISAQKNFTKDDQAHLFGGMAVSSLAIQYNKSMLDGKLNNFVVAVASSAVAGTVKELIDANEPNNKFDKKDLGYTIFGGLITYGLHEAGVPNWIIMSVGVGGMGVVMSF